METLVGTSTTRSHLYLRNPFNPPPGSLPRTKRVRCRGIQNGSSPFPVVSIAYPIGSISSRNCSPFVPKAKKTNTNGDDKRHEKKQHKKADTHSFAPKPDEATGPFPEALLLREKKVQEDGTFLPEFTDEEEQALFEYLSLQLESDLQVDRMRHYEVVYLIHQDFEEQVENVNSKIQDFLKEKQGKVWRFSDWGMRRLAYKIKKATHAHYILMNFELEAQWINDLKTMLDQDERVIRHLVIKRDKAITEECPPPPEFHSLRGDTDDYEEDDADDDDEDDDDEEWEDEDEDEIELEDGYDEGGVEEESVLKEGDRESAGSKQPSGVETPRKKNMKIQNAVR